MQAYEEWENMISKIVGEYLKKGSIIVYESTVYPGVTEDTALV